MWGCASGKQAASVDAAPSPASAEHVSPKPLISEPLYQLKEVNPAPQLIRSSSPDYTYEMVKNKVEGFVSARVLVGSNGKVRDVEISRDLGHGTGEETKKALLNYVFMPAKKDGHPVAVWISMTVNFKPLGN